jgi:hypothetical protein
MHNRGLRELIKLTLLEFKGEEEKLRGWFEDSGDESESLLAKHGLVMLQSPKENERNNVSSMLGRGYYSRAYEVLYKGKRAVAKITKSKKDVETLVHLESLRDKLPERMAKHILKVYETFEIKDDNGITNYVAVIEHLVPMPKSLKTEYWTGDVENKKTNDRKSALLDDSQDIASILVDVIVDAIKKLRSKSLREKMSKLFTAQALRSIKKHVSNDENIADKIKDDDLNTSIDNTERYVKDVLKRSNIVIRKDVMSMIAYDLLYTIGQASKGERFPSNAKDETEKTLTKLSKDKRIYDLWKTLEYLKSKHGIEWWDVHQENVMVRPSTGDLVISDPGMFEY